MPDDNDSKLYDKRVVQRYLQNGDLDEKDYERHLKALPDLAENAVAIEAALDSEALDDLDEEDDEAEADGAKEG